MKFIKDIIFIKLSIIFIIFSLDRISKTYVLDLFNETQFNEIYLSEFLNFPKKFENIELNNKWIELIKIRDICNMSIEEKRANKEIGSSLEASLEIKINKLLFDISKNTDFAELCITSHAEISEFRGDSIEVKTIKAKGTKCPTCWKIRESKCLRPLCANV